MLQTYIRISDKLNTLRPYAPVVLRIGISLMFLWFGSNQIMSPADWVGFIPESITSFTGISATILVLLNGVFEIVFGSALLVGFFTRISALALAVHLTHITFIVGFDSIGVRDAGLSVATLVIAMYGADMWSLDAGIFEESGTTKVE